MKNRTPLIALPTALAASLLLAACSSSSTTTSSTTSASGASSSIPAGTVLHVGEQLKNLSTILAVGKQDQGFTYKVDYSEFVGGPPMLQAFQGGALDVGYVASTPLIFAQAANQKVVAVGGWANKGATGAVVSAPDTNGISGWAGLKGKRVAYQEGTSEESGVLSGLDSVGLSLKDITPVNVPITQVSATLHGGSADAGVLPEPLLSAYLQSNPAAKTIVRPTGLTDRAGFLVANAPALASSGTSAAIADYLTRLVRAYAYLSAHPDKVATAVYQNQYGLSTERAKAVATNAGGVTFFPLPGPILPEQQRLADLYHQAGAIPDKLNVRAQFDPRFNSVVAKAQS